MALRVWLPLNGNLENKGLSNLQITNVGATVDDDGKLGPCYSFNGSNSRIACSAVSWTYPLSVCGWFYPTNASGAATSYFISYNKDANGTAGHVIGIGTINNGSTLTVWAGGSAYSTGVTLEDNVWYHFTATIDENKNYKFYVNGELTVSGTCGDNPGSTWLTFGARSNSTSGGAAAASYFFKGKMNDIRVYDECLSPKQVKEISKGLVAHYKLDGAASNRNYIINSLFRNKTSAGIYTFHDDMVTFSTDTLGQTTGIDFTNSIDSLGLTDFRNKVLTFSMEYKIDEAITFGTTKPWIGFELSVGRNTTTGGSSQYLGWYGGTSIPTEVTNGWVRYTVQKAITDYDIVSLKVNFYMRDATGTISYRRPKIEISDVPTDWIPNPTDGAYSELGFNNIVKKDVSGNGYDLTSVDTNMFVDIDSPRYKAALRRESATQSMGTIPVIFSLGQEINELTLSGWLKTDASLVNKNLINLGNNKFIRFGPTVTGNLWVYIRMGDVNKSLDVASIGTLDNLWHHYVVTFKDGVITAYIDGTQKGTADYSSTATSITCAETNNYIGAYSINQELVSGSVSDIRIYATALSADDVKQLYQTSAWIDNGQNFCTYEFKEE